MHSALMKSRDARGSGFMNEDTLRYEERKVRGGIPPPLPKKTLFTTMTPKGYVNHGSVFLIKYMCALYGRTGRGEDGYYGVGGQSLVDLDSSCSFLLFFSFNQETFCIDHVSVIKISYKIAGHCPNPARVFFPFHTMGNKVELHLWIYGCV
jgi:hypothetical protein